MIRSEQLAAWCAGQWRGDPPPVSFTGVAHDSREVGPGMLYAAIRGERFDGHAFVGAARAAGATAALVESAAGESFPSLCVADTRKALLDLARGYRSTIEAPIIGITGSVGKTTVKEMIGDIFSSSGEVTRTRGNWNNELGLPLSLLNMSPTARYGVFEVGISHPGEMERLAGALRPDWAVITPIGPAHIAFFSSEEHIAREKAELLRALADFGPAVLSVDDRWYGVLREYVEGRCVTVSLDPSVPADYLGCMEQGGDGMTISGSGHSGLRVRLPLPGRHVARNALLASALCLEMGMSEAAVAAAIAWFRPPGMRWTKEYIADVTFVNDAYNANPMSMRAAVEAFGGMSCAGRRWVVLGGMHELGAREEEEHRLMGTLLATGSWAGIITVGSRARGMAEGALEAGWPEARLHVCGDCREAARVLLQANLKHGDHVLLKASRADQLEEVITYYTDGSRQA